MEMVYIVIGLDNETYGTSGFNAMEGKHYVKRLVHALIYRCEVLCLDIVSRYVYRVAEVTKIDLVRSRMAR